MSAAGLLWTAPATAQLVGNGEVGWSGPAIAFVVIALLIIGGAISTISQKNNIAAVMSLVATFFGLAAMYALLSAHFLAALQVLVYAGAIMVLFIFVVMVLNRDEGERWAVTGVVTKFIGVLALVYTLARIGFYLYAVQPAHLENPPEGFGTVADVGNLLFTDYLFAFEAVSLLLLIAVVAAVVLAKARHPSAEPLVDRETGSGAGQSTGGVPPHVGDHH